MSGGGGGGGKSDTFFGGLQFLSTFIFNTCRGSPPTCPTSVVTSKKKKCKKWVGHWPPCPPPPPPPGSAATDLHHGYTTAQNDENAGLPQGKAICADHSYEPSSIRAPPPNLKFDEFGVQPLEVEAVECTKEMLIQYMLSKTLTDSSMSSLKEIIAKSTNLTPPEKSHAFYLGVINQHADDIETIKGTLELLQKQLQIPTRMRHLIVVGDAKTYGHLVRIKQEYVKDIEWLIPFPGDWHILKNLQPVLMKIYYHAGLQDLAAKNHKGATLSSLAACGHFKRTHIFLLSAWEAMFRCQLKAFMNSKDVKISDLALLDKLHNLATEDDLQVVLQTMEEVWDHVGGQTMAVSFSDFTKKQEEKDGTYQLWNAFIHRDALSYVLLYLAIRTGNWNLRVAALKMMGPLFHAFDRPMYLQLIPGHLADILQMPPTILEHLQQGGFVISLKGRSGHSVGLDEGHETLINKDVKMALHKPEPLLMDKMAMYLPYRAMSQDKLRDQVLPPGDSSTASQTMSQCKTLRDEVSAIGVFSPIRSDERGAREGAEEEMGGQFRELSEETIMVLHSGRGSTKNFAKRIVFQMIDPEMLMNSNCHGRTNKTSKRPNVQAIDPRVLSYAF